jgi:hypothetical protein
MRIMFTLEARFRPERAPHATEHVHLTRAVDWNHVPRKGDHIDLDVGAPANLIEVKEATFHMDGTVVVRLNWLPLNREDVEALRASGWEYAP